MYDPKEISLQLYLLEKNSMTNEAFICKLNHTIV